MRYSGVIERKTGDHARQRHSDYATKVPESEVIRIDSHALPDSRGNHGLQRASGVGRVVLAGSAAGTRLVEEYQKFPVRVMFPAIAGRSAKEAVIVNSSGGVAGGDRLEFEVVALDNAEVAVTSQAAEKIYRAIDEPARISTQLRAYGNAKLAWLPQETIIFDQARVRRRTEIDIYEQSELMALEWLVLGRAAYGEEISGGLISESWRIRLDGRLIWADDFHVEGDTFAQLHRKALLSKFKAMATLIYHGPDVDKRLQIMRSIAMSLQCQCVATAVGSLIIVRAAAVTSFELRKGLRSLIERFGAELAPGPFAVPKMWSC